VKAIYFADTFFWVALNYPSDNWHAHVIAWATAHTAAQLVTTEEVLAEFLTWFSASGGTGRSSAAATVRDILSDPLVRVLPQTSTGFRAALTLYESRNDKSYSLCDCRSMLAMKELRISDVLTNDRHFAQEGSTIIFP
jgi:uncharacterized protein